MPAEVAMHRRSALAPLVVTLATLGALVWAGSTAALVGAAPQPQVATAAAAPAAVPVADGDIEQFLLKANVVRTRSAGKGITGSLRATLSDGVLTHDAHIQIIDESKREFRSDQGVEFNFRDSWSFNVAAYKIDRLLGLKLVPVTVQRRWRTSLGSFTWWLDDVMMDEAERLKRKAHSPDPQGWNEEMQLVRLFDQLIANIDRNLGNLVITKDWQMWAIDHTRAFRTTETLKSPANVARCDRQIFERLKALDRATLRRELSGYLHNWEIDAVLKRRDAIVTIIEQKGAAGLFDRRRKFQ
jgi:hypothetical protein